METKKSPKIREMVYISLFAVLISVCSWLSIPTTVPFTMQTFAIFCTLGLLRGKNGTLAILVYILLGAIGIPVFSGFKAGVGALFGTTGGYILGFLLSALIYWLITKKFGTKTLVVVISMLAGLLVCYAFGTAWFMYVYANSTGPIGLLTALGWCVFPFIIPDIIKISLAVFMTKKLAPYVKL